MPITIFTSNYSDSCEQAMSYLRSEKIPFTEKNVHSDLAYAQEAEDLGYVTPTIVLENATQIEVMVGFSESAFRRAHKSYKRTKN